MKKTIPAFLFSAATLLTVACNNNAATTNAGDSVTPSDSVYPPVEKNKANTDYKPAFEGQTRIAGVKTTTPYGHTVLTDKLKSPWGIAVLPDGRALVTEKEGTMRIVSADGTVSEAITGIPKVDSQGQGGLLGLTLDPNFASNRMVYWVFSEPVNGGNHTAVGKGKLAEDEKSIEGATVIYQALPTYDGKLHYGGRIIFDKSGNLLVSTGERSDLATRPQSQDLKSALGKIVRITTDGKPAAGNPFASDANALPEIYSYGHRNVQGIALHPETGDLWETEFGPRGGDELNRVEAGKNYGWPTITYGLEYSGKEIGTPPIQQQEGMEQPVYYWDPVLSPSGLMFYTGNAIPEWKNNLFIGGLSSTHIARIIIKDNKVVGEERLLEKEGQRFRDVIQGKDGEILAITDAGRLYKISKD
ncbi:PQQ-dependent sugar dehydrogenase [Sphingobacterium wenxiniae]|uniref:Glucose/arabinose dehydrogenase, beta-propeller fold n=1 Tax=Sphingobacterium wenxiniae TaxID=683125 RepID=A0A1I6NQM5_9SPHI|nr:PQQ-dependent sugar dehydrogenase [Sphingobacterium wenxiniae]SFS30302.1 Glucose/arabinose dehydrogenase, beta-propeller fold [Sphingobacterium wenxiniae]